MVVLSDAITPQKSMVHRPTKYVYRLNQGGEHDYGVRIDRGGRWDGVISILNKRQAERGFARSMMVGPPYK